MAAEVSNSGGGVNIDVFPWLKSMPVAPEFHPTLAEFEDPIAYIFKIEKQASQYGICKIVPPVPPPSRKTFLANLNKSLLARCSDSDSDPTFTTRQQQVGFCPRKHRPVLKSVWQSGERYNLLEFEAKAKNFEKGYLKRYNKKVLSALEMETLYWNAMVDKPFDVEYANDMPGSAFPKRKTIMKNEGSLNVGDTDWNMRVVSRTGCSLLRYMKEEIPGVTSPMVYVAMMFSWFAWHVEDHDLHSLNYLHMGAGKTWYGVPREAAVAFEEVVREHGYGGEINPLVTFSRLGEKTTIMSPEVLLNAGVPCCRLVQNAGEFVITFPRAYHSGFSHGFNCGEASNIATPEWLRVAKEAAIRRASINCPPMVSHFQLLYDLVVSLCSRTPKSIVMEPRSSRLRDKKKGEGEVLIKELFCRDMMKNNSLLHVLGKGSPAVLLPENYLNGSIFPKKQAEIQPLRKARLFSDLCITTDLKIPGESIVEQIHLAKHAEVNTVNGNFFSSDERDMDLHMNKGSQSEQSLFSCVTCGILCFACVAIVQPTLEAARYIMTADYSILSDLTITKDGHITNSVSEFVPKKPNSACASSLVQSTVDDTLGRDSKSNACKGPSSLGLLALAYCNTSDSEADEGEADDSTKIDAEYIKQRDSCDNVSVEIINKENDSSMEMSNSCTDYSIDRGTLTLEDSHGSVSDKFQTKNSELAASNSLIDRSRIQITTECDASNTSLVHREADETVGDGLTQSGNRVIKYFPSRSNEDSSRLHVFCLEHAMQVESWLRPIGGAHVSLLCHPDYPNLESKAQKIAEELEIDHVWTETSFCEVTKQDDDVMRLALKSENAIHGNGDWAVKLGINLFYSANLSRSPLYSKQMPYNSIIYSVFGRNSLVDTDVDVNNSVEYKGLGRQKRSAVAGKWCGKVWMSSQAHPLLVSNNNEEQVHESGVWTRTDSKLERESAVKYDTRMATTIRTYKRKSTASNVKTMSLEEEISDDSSEDFTLSNMHKQIKKIKRGTKRLTKGTPCVEKLDESGEESRFSNNSRKRVKTASGTKRMKEEIQESESSDESLEEFPLDNLWKKQNKSKHASKPMQKNTPEPHKSKKKIKKKTNSQLEEEEEEEEEDKDGPNTRSRKRTKSSKKSITAAKPAQTKQQKDKKAKKAKPKKVQPSSNVSDNETTEDYPCDIEGCIMGFHTKQELTLHKKNICPVKGCGKKFFSHKYLVQHRRVHMDDRPLKCPWKGCKMTFKWAWARTEHIRVHTGARPYVCTVSGCGQTFRFVSDFSRHKRKTGHTSKKVRK